MILVASSNGMVGMGAAMEILRAGGSAMDAVESGVRQVEADPAEHTVGYGGYPNILGEVELDASIMDGHTLESGAVGAIRGYPHPISIARQVLAQLPHVLLVGAGAERFAAEMGFARRQLLTDEARRTWLARLQQDMPPEAVAQLGETATLRHWVRLATDPERVRGTVNLIAQDQAGHIAAGVSTSGWAWKYPGRLGDSPIIGAGNYADDRYGAAACTGMGEMAIRAATAHSLVFYMKMGLSVVEAGQQAVADLNDLGGPFISGMNVIALDRDGRHAGFSTLPDRTYIFQDGDMAAPAEVARLVVPVAGRWAHAPGDAAGHGHPSG